MGMLDRLSVVRRVFRAANPAQLGGIQTTNPSAIEFELSRTNVIVAKNQPSVNG
jgi:hypothetical protein